MDAIYMDHAASAPFAPGVREAMRDAAVSAWGNPSSVHAAGRGAKRLLERAREQVADAIGAQPADVVFTSGGSEACCAGIEGLYRLLRGRGERPRIATSSVEHPAVGESLAALIAGHEAPLLKFSPAEQVVGTDLTENALLACQWINHETGVVLPVKRWAEQVRSSGGLVFIDASQALGKVPLNVAELPFDALAIAASKIGGPTGSGALWVRRGVDIDPLVRGGGQERARRGGTQNVLGAVGFGAACVTIESQLADMARLRGLRDQLEGALRQSVEAEPNAGQFERCATISNLWFAGVHAQRLVAALDVEGLMVSAGSACSAGIAEPSSVITALYPDAPERGSQSIRFSLGSRTQEHHVKQAVSIVISVLSRFKT